jgi:nucleoside-diphosphate-sugar epimerase
MKRMNIVIVGAAGYCGSYLARKLKSEHKIITLDIRPGCDIEADYRDFLSWWHELQAADIILWFAGASSVKTAELDPSEALDNNCLGLLRLAEKLRTSTYLVYASSASVYSRGIISRPPCSLETDITFPATSIYDKSKFAIDYLMSGFFSNFLSLRMGTVCGFSKPMREETLFNSMNLSALKRQIITLSNPNSWRSILFLDDLLSLINVCIDARPKGILNTASLNITIGNLAEEIAKFYRADIDTVEGSTGYSFRLDLSKMHNLMESNKLSSKKEHSLIEYQCLKFRESWLYEHACN